MPSVRKRSVQIKVTLTPELHAQLGEVSRQLGQVPATLASVAISQWVAIQARQLGAADRAVDQVVESLGPLMAEQLKLAGGVS